MTRGCSLGKPHRWMVVAVTAAMGCGRAGYAVEDGGSPGPLDAPTGIDVRPPTMDASGPDAPTVDDDTGLVSPDTGLALPDAFLGLDAAPPADPDAFVDLDAGPRTCVVASDCPPDTACLAGLCRYVLFEDDFEDGVIGPEWSLMRFTFAETGGVLRSQPTTRPGFMYGHVGNGRSPVAAVGIGAEWTDVHVEWTQQSFDNVPIVDSGLPACQHTPNFGFRVLAYTESWNDPFSTYYGFAIDQGCDGPIGPPGTFGLSVTYDYYIPGFGWSAASSGTGYAVTNGTISPIADAPVHFVLDVVGSHYTLSADGVMVFDVTDAPHAGGESPIPRGGMLFSSAWEQMFALDDVEILDLSRFVE
ncbi:MAG: hypothetical protein K1X94_15685 [Sandaracinaceae bacterium]|nr:hypothetical protein [Sandaracinaceae bacterium]